ncbi:hypothetical protein FGB62_71g218 [Gracilaria domingensis]|nr:hypothetical protein FGB62_71g218 [Gracilaria domingensis]
MLNVQLHRFRRRLASPSRKEEKKCADDASATLLDSDSVKKAARPLTEKQQTSSPAETSRRARRRQRPIRVPTLSHSSSIIATAHHVSPLHAHLPVRYQACDWQNVYSTMRHGISLQTFYMNCAGSDPIVVLIRDDGGSVFGAYSSVPWKSSKHYYGTGEGFVFTISPNLAVYKWSRENSFFQLGSSESIALGGGGKFALFLDSMFEHGSSGPCATFNNPCLASKQEFNVVVLEAYKLVSPYRLRHDDEQ